MARPKLTEAQQEALRARHGLQGARLRRLRTALGLTQQEAAAQAGLKNYGLSRMESGTHPIDPLALQLLCEAHGIGADYVIVASVSALPAPLRDKILQLEQEEMQQAQAVAKAKKEGQKEDERAKKLAPDIVARLEALTKPRTEPDPSHPRKRKSLQALWAIEA